MTKTNPAASYFDEVANQWDDLRSAYFTEAVRDAAIARAYLRPEMQVADVGAGTGFMTAGLAPLVQKVYALDGSAAMLAVARRNLQGLDNIVFETADGLRLPLPDHSVHVVFANMYLHHCPDPLAAICEMVRILRPGGRLILTDLDAHPYAWLKEEMADIWQGFEREQILDWYAAAGLVNRLVDCTGQSCCAESQSVEPLPDASRTAKISVFVAAGTKPVTGVAGAVQQDYAAHATGEKQACCTSGGTGASCCGGAAQQTVFSFAQGYSPAEQNAIPAEAVEISLGCGNPTALAGLRQGEVVLDIGSGGGVDAFLAAKKIGDRGRVIGVDMTPAMIERASRAARAGGYDQVEFRLGEAENLPVEDASVDVVLSNCVINLTRDKGKVFAEAYRVLKPGGRLEVSDVVGSGSLPAHLSERAEEWSGCVSGALPESEYMDLIRQAGFCDVSIRRSYTVGEMAGTRLYSVIVSARKGSAAGTSVCCG